MGFETQDVERKVNAILKILRDSREVLGARVIARRLKEQGIELGERAVRYHLKLMDGRGLTQLMGRDGRLITESGIEELTSALVRDKVRACSNKYLSVFKIQFFKSAKSNEACFQSRALRQRSGGKSRRGRDAR